MSSTPVQPAPEDSTDPVITETPAPEHAPQSAHPDPITGEPGAHPVGVGVGALGAGAAGAAIGSIGGPIGMLIGAAIGAVAGGLAGKEVATTSEEALADEKVEPADAPTEVTSTGTTTPVSMNTMPGEGLRVPGGSGFSDDEGLLSTGTTGMPGATAAAVVDPVDAEDDALPTPTHVATAGETAFQAPAVPETAPLAGAVMPHSGEEAVQVSAYYHYLGRTTTGEPGDAMGDWLAAEREMMLN